MALEWRVKEFLKAHSISAYRLMKESSLAQGTVYRLANNQANGLNLETLDAVIEALRRLTGKRVVLADLLEYEDEEEDGQHGKAARQGRGEHLPAE
jgi:DNA-binding Xre family transcriptional regulator